MQSVRDGVGMLTVTDDALDKGGENVADARWAAVSGSRAHTTDIQS